MSEHMVSQVTGRRGARGDAAPLVRLTDRELEVFELIGRALETREIARQLHLSVKTVETYQARVKEKLGLKNGHELIRAAVSWMQL
jgi:DNA-binding NarL/FixJ family response regulator